jgi:RNA polymerase sigma-70 factor (ECF subfamily)
MPDPTDESLARDAQSGSRSGFEQLVLRYQVPLIRFLQRGPTPNHAEDDVQETFLRVYRSLDKYNADRPFRPWLFSVAYRQALDRRRSIRKTVAVNENIAGTQDDNPSKSVADADTRRHVWSIARRALKAEPFSCLWLHYAESMPVAEVATALGRTQVWVKTSLLRSRRRLKEHLQADHGNREPEKDSAKRSGPDRVQRTARSKLLEALP